RPRGGRAGASVVATRWQMVSMTFRFRKLYADVVSDDGTVTIVYLTWLELWGARFASAGVERYGPDGGREVQHARPQAWEFSPDSVGDGWGVRLELPNGDFELRYESALGSWRPSGDLPDPAMEWRGLVPPAGVVGRSGGRGGAGGARWVRWGRGRAGWGGAAGGSRWPWRWFGCGGGGRGRPRCAARGAARRAGRLGGGGGDPGGGRALAGGDDREAGGPR